jgi:hypothetical protein
MGEESLPGRLGEAEFDGELPVRVDIGRVDGIEFDEQLSRRIGRPPTLVPNGLRSVR